MFTETESTFGDGEWVVAIHNEKINDQKLSHSLSFYITSDSLEYIESPFMGSHRDLIMRRTRIVATIGPSSDDDKTLQSLLKSWGQRMPIELFTRRAGAKN